jgi:hypothetical protein
LESTLHISPSTRHHHPEAEAEAEAEAGSVGDFWGAIALSKLSKQPHSSMGKERSHSPFSILQERSHFSSSLVMSPHSQDFYRFLYLNHLIDKAVLNVDSS